MPLPRFYEGGAKIAPKTSFRTLTWLPPPPIRLMVMKAKLLLRGFYILKAPKGLAY